ncbi:MAG: thioesterase family protein [Thermodesulfobacteriota bacterium]
MSEKIHAGRTCYRVLYGDCDSMGVMYYGHYLRLFERGRAELIRDLGLSYKECERRGAILPVTETYCHYHRSVEYDDLVVIETRVGEVKRASVRFDYEIYRDGDNNEKLAEGYTRHACISPEKKIIRLPAFLQDVLAGALR